MNSRNLRLILAGIFILIIITCSLFYKVKSDLIAKRYYKQGLEFYEKENYSDAYYNFKQIKPFSSLYKIALIKEYQCATMLSDKKTAISRLKILIKTIKDENTRPSFLYKEASLAQEMNLDSKDLTYKKFKYIYEKYPKNDYGIASTYRAGKVIETRDKQEATRLYLKYLENAPDGKYALFALEAIEKLQTHLDIEDYEIIANAYLANKNYQNAVENYEKTSFENNWYNISKCYRGLNRFNKEKDVLIEGLELNSSPIEEISIKSALNRLIYLTKADKIQTLQNIYTKNKNSYVIPTVTYLLAENSSSIRGVKLYEDVVENYEDSIWASNSLWEMFWYNYKLKRYKVCQQYAQLHMEKYSTAKDAPRVAYWYGRVLLKERDTKEARDVFYKVIKEYPLSYYAFLSAKQLKMSKAKKMIVKKPITNYNINSINKYVFKDKLLLQLANYDDYTTIEDFKINNEDIKSWIAYKKGNYPKSITTIKDKLNNNTVASSGEEESDEENEKTQISFSDFELKLMYPILFSDLINNYAYKYKQSPYLFLSLVREESHFNAQAKSSAGAIGLSQIMKPTANFIEKENVSTETLLNEEQNIRIGLKYFQYLVEYFKGDESLAILAYNAGPGNVNKWLADSKINFDDIDTFVENVPYIETNSYIKKILSSYWVYLNIYSIKNKG